ncbi:MAG: hypothetical protein GEU99_08555 [Luteitalea sp.]|nr:hypothetical protein [Luteitalea sp.]
MVPLLLGPSHPRPAAETCRANAAVYPMTARTRMPAAWRAHLKATIETALDPFITPFSECALVDFPTYPNVGDHAIWLGTVDYLRSRGVRIKYICHPLNYSASELRRTVRQGPIVIQGGGNFGDLWQDHQLLRERIVQNFPDKAIIQLPQSIHFASQTNLQRARSIFNAHPNLLLFVRDQPSLAFAQSHFSCKVRLCPDLAFLMRHDRLVRAESQPGMIVYLSRGDKEAATDKLGAELAVAGLVVVDWVKRQPSKWKQAYEATRRPRWGPRLVRMLQRIPTLTSGNQKRRLYAANRMAQERLDYGCRLLGAGQVVVTDRLHAHILATCLDLPNVVFDNSYGKVAAFVQEWTRDIPGVSLCNGEEEAIRKAQEIRSSMSGGG